MSKLLSCACGAFFLMATLAAAAPPAGQVGDPPVALEPMSVMESVLNVHLEIEYGQVPYQPAWVERMYVGRVKPGSIADRAGLRTGMEIIAIQGKKVARLSEGAVQALLVQGVADHVELTVRRGWFHRPEQIRLPVPPRGT